MEEITRQKILADLELDDLDSKITDEVVNNIFNSLYLRASMIIEDKLSDEDMKQAIDIKDAEDRLLFIAKKVGGFSSIVYEQYQQIINEVKAQIDGATK